MPDDKKTTDAPAEGDAPDTSFGDTPLSEISELVLGGLYGASPLKPKPEPPAEPKPAAPPKPATEPAAKPTAAAAAPAPAPTPAPQPTADEIAERVASRLTPPPAPEPAKPSAVDPDAAFNEDDRDALRVIEYMERQEPKFAGKSVEQRKFLKAEADYVAKWTKENPEQEFDGDADEHNEFYEKNRPAVDDKAINRWRTEMIADEKATRMMEKDRTDRNRAGMARQIQGQTAQVQAAIGKEILETVGGKGVKNLAALAEEDPLAAEAVAEAQAGVNALIDASERLFTPGTPHAPTKNDPIEGELLRRTLIDIPMSDGKVQLSYEGEIAAMPAAESDWNINGQRLKFTRYDEWIKLPKEQKATRWTIVQHPEIVANFLRRDAKAEATVMRDRKYDLARKTASKLGFKAPDSSGNGTPPPTPTPPKKNPPNISGGGAAPVTTLGQGGATEKGMSDLIQSGLYPGR